MSKQRTTAGACVVALLASLALAVGYAPAASADNNCTPPMCGVVVNHSSFWTKIAGGGSPARATANGWCETDHAPRYGGEPFSCDHELRSLYASDPDSTKYFHDTDSFRSDAGCVIKYKDTAWLSPAFSNGSKIRVDDRRGKAKSKWIRLGNGDTIDITYQSCSGTPTKYYVNTWAKGYGYQDQFCADDSQGSAPPWGYNTERCNRDGELYVGNNYFYCKMSGARVGTSSSYNTWWLLTDLDYVYDPTTTPSSPQFRDGRSFVSAYYLTGGPNASNNSAYYYNGSSWQWIPTC